MRQVVFAGAAVGALFLLQGCIAAVGYAVGQAEVERLKQQELWAASLDRLECDQLAEVDTELKAEKDDLVDYDQRQDILDDKREAKGCA